LLKSGHARHTLSTALRHQSLSHRPTSRAAWLVLPALLYYALVLAYSVNAPFWDDFELLRVRPAERVGELQWLLRSHNEHRIVLTRLVATALQALEGHLDFRHLSIVGNLLLAPIAVMMFRASSRARSAPLLFAPVVALLFAPHSWENLIWPTASVTSYGVVLFAWLSLQQFSKGGWGGLATSLALATCAALTGVSGLLVFPVLALWALARVLDTGRESHDKGHERTPAWLVLIAVAAAGLTVGALFSRDHARPPESSMFEAALQHPLEAAARVAVVLGSFTNAEHLTGSSAAANWIGLAAGVMTLAFFADLVRRGLARKEPLLFYFACFALLCACVIAIGRAEFGIGQALSSRYVIVSASMLGALYLGWLGLAETDAAAGPARLRWTVALTLAYLVFSTVASLPRLTRRHDFVTQGMQRWVETGEGLSHHEPEHVEPILRRAIADGLYRPPE